jgi:hypothetical protein
MVHPIVSASLEKSEKKKVKIMLMEGGITEETWVFKKKKRNKDGIDGIEGFLTISFARHTHELSMR